MKKTGGSGGSLVALVSLHGGLGRDGSLALKALGRSVTGVHSSPVQWCPDRCVLGFQRAGGVVGERRP